MVRTVLAAASVMMLLTGAGGCTRGDASSPVAATTEDVTVTLEQFGIGSVFRPGEFTGIRVGVRSELEESINAWVQWEVPNADGDVAEYGRTIPLSPGKTTSTWLFAPLPPNAGGSSVWSVRVFEEVDGRRRGELGGTKISPSVAGATVAALDSGMVAVIGPSNQTLGLSDLTRKWSEPTPAGAHEDTRVVHGIAPEDLPDKWEAWKAFELVAWGDASPQGIGSERAAALREYIRRGGHLFISLPEDGDPWGLGKSGQTEFDDLLPARTPETIPRKIEGVKLAELLPVVSKHPRVDRDFSVSIRVFKSIGAPGAPGTPGTPGAPGGVGIAGDAVNAIDNGYEPLIALPDGRVVVIQRSYGFGRITVSGIDLTSGQLLSATRGRPQGDVFWNRVLGRRADTPDASELSEMETARRLGGRSATEINVGRGDLFSGELDLSRRAGQLMLLALVLFAAYWCLAGPVGFALLKQFRQVQHSWLSFAAAAAVFTAIASGSVALLRQEDVQIKHVSFLDEIEYAADDPRGAGVEPELDRAVSFLSLYLPEYGRRLVEIEPLEGRPERNLLASWIPPGEESQTFPNATRYRVDVGRNPASFELPARSTATQLVAHWMGVPDAALGRTISIETGDPVRAVGGDLLSGSLKHNLPGTLTNVLIIHVKNNRTPPRRYFTTGGQAAPWVDMRSSGDVLNTGTMWVQPSWPTDAPLDLRTLGSATNLTLDIDRRYLDDYKRDRGTLPTLPSGATLSDAERRRFIEMLSLYHQLTPPAYIKSDANTEPPTVIARRELGRELDLSAWFNRPCLIIIGYLEGSPSPLPLRVEGEPVRSEGLTVVRWIHPLPLDEGEVRRNGVAQAGL